MNEKLDFSFDFDLKESRMAEEAARREKTLKAEEDTQPKEKNMENIYVVAVVWSLSHV